MIFIKSPNYRRFYKYWTCPNKLDLSEWNYVYLSRWIKFFAAVVTLFCNFSCKDDRMGSRFDYKLDLEVDTLAITIEETQLFDYPYSSVFETSNEQLFIGYNKPLHSLDIFSLTEKKFIKSINLAKEGPNSLDPPFDFFVHNLDSIYYYSNDYTLNIVDQNGVIVDRNVLENFSGLKGLGDHKVNFITQPVNLKLFYDARSNSVFFHTYSMEAGTNKKAYYEAPILSEIDIDFKTVHEYPFYFPDSYKRDGEYLGEYYYPNIHITDSLLIFSFPNSPEINVYDRKLDELLAKRVESKKTKNSVTYLPSEAHADIQVRFNHLIENPYFYHTVFDPFRNLFYRTHRGEHPNPDLNLGNIDFSYTKDYLTVMDQDLNLLQEIELPSHKYDALSFFVTKDGLHLPYTHYLNEEVKEDKLVFHIYKFHFERED